jgi:Na+/citrate or Na+/malate symporter
VAAAGLASSGVASSLLPVLPGSAFAFCGVMSVGVALGSMHARSLVVAVVPLCSCCVPCGCPLASFLAPNSLDRHALMLVAFALSM